MEVYPGSSGWIQCNPAVLTKEEKGRGVREDVMTEAESTAMGGQELTNVDSKEMHFPKASRKHTAFMTDRFLTSTIVK